MLYTEATGPHTCSLKATSLTRVDLYGDSARCMIVVLALLSVGLDPFFLSLRVLMRSQAPMETSKFFHFYVQEDLSHVPPRYFLASVSARETLTVGP